MAEPARKLDPVYDPEDNQPDTKPDLKALEGGGETSPSQRDWYNASNPKSATEPDDLNEVEKNGGESPQHEGTLGKGYNSGPGEHHSSLRSRLIKGRGRKAAIGGSVAALIIAGLIALFVALIPLKILHVVNNLQSRFYASAEVAVEQQVDNLFSRYVRGKILNGCKGPIIDQTCNPYDGSSLVRKLYRGWSDGRLEEKLRKQTGMEIRKIKEPDIYEMRFVGTDDAVDLTDLKNNKTISEIIDAKGDWTEVKKSQVKSVYKSALKSTTRHASTMYYVKVTPYLAKKFGILWCVIGCDKKQDFSKWKANKKLAAKMWLAERVLGPRAELYGMILQCIYAPDKDCSKERIINAEPQEYSADVEGCNDGCNPDGNGRPISPRLTEMELAIAARLASYGSNELNLRKIFEFFEKYGFVGGTARSIVDGINKEGKSRGEGELDNDKDAIDEVNKQGEDKKLGQGGKSVRILGWIGIAATLSQFIEAADDAPQVIARLQYVTNTTTMAQLWGMYRTSADELKEGEIDAEIYGSFVSSLGPGLQPVDETVTDPSNEEDQVGGLAGAEATPLYQALISDGSNAPAGISSAVRSIFSPSALAQETKPENNTYLCEGGNPPPAGQLVCAEEKLNGVGKIATALEQLKKIPGWPLLAKAAEAFNSVINGFIGAIFSALDFITKGLFGDLVGAVADLVGELAKFAQLDIVLKAIAEWMLGINLNMVSNNMSGGRTFDMMAAGADVSGNDFVHHGIGGVVLKPEQVAQNLDYYHETQLAEYNQKSFFAKILDTESPYSPASKVALSMPSNTTSALNNINSALATFIKNPFGKVINSFASLFTLQTKAAGFIPGKDPFGITQYGYPLDDPIFKEDPDEYWKKYCVSNLPDGSPNPNFLTQKWNQFAADNLNPDNFEPENYQTSQFSGIVPGNNYGTNGCLLIQAAVGSAGAIFTDDVLSAEELAALQPETASGSTGGPVDCSAPSGVDQSPGEPPAQYRDFIIAAAEGLTCPDYPKPSGAVPDTPGKQYMAYDGCSDNCAIQGTIDGKRYIRVKYRNPPLAGNTINIFIDP